jgi:hypothetical protein
MFSVLLQAAPIQLSLLMKGCFWGLWLFLITREFGKLGPCQNVVFSFGWLLKRVWTVDRLAKRGLNHPEKCPLCDQEDETLDHLLVTCSFSREFWYLLLRKFGLHSLAPQPNVGSYLVWWEKRTCSLIILGAWILWNHRNKCVFDGYSPNVIMSLRAADEERKKMGDCWCQGPFPFGSTIS